MPRAISQAEALRLLRAAEAEGLPIEIVCSDGSEQAMMLTGRLIVNDNDTIVIHIPGIIGMFVSIPESLMEYSEPAEAPESQRLRAIKLRKFLIKFRLGEWECMLRVWKDPHVRTIN